MSGLSGCQSVKKTPPSGPIVCSSRTQEPVREVPLGGMGVVQELRVSVTTFSTYHRGMTTNNSCSPGSSWFWSVLPRGVCYTGSGSTGSSDHLSSDRILVGSTRTKLVTVRDRRRFESGGTTNISNQN